MSPSSAQRSGGRPGRRSRGCGTGASQRSLEERADADSQEDSMDLMTRAEFEELMGDGGGPRVSVFVPTHRVSRAKESEADRLSWKNLLSTVEAALLDEGHGRREIDELL